MYLPQVQDAWPEILHKHKLLKAGQTSLTALPALAIDATDSKSTVTGFKEVWDTTRAHVALKKDHIYEAGASLAWVSALMPPPCPVDPLLLTTVAWHCVVAVLCLCVSVCAWRLKLLPQGHASRGRMLRSVGDRKEEAAHLSHDSGCVVEQVAGRRRVAQGNAGGRWKGRGCCFLGAFDRRQSYEKRAAVALPSIACMPRLKSSRRCPSRASHRSPCGVSSSACLP